MTGTAIGGMGRVSFQDDFATIEFERHVMHPPELVWSAITDQNKLSKWYLSKVVIEEGSGGRIDLWFSRIHVYGKIKRWDPPRVFEHEWNVDPGEGISNQERTIIRWELLEEGEGTLIKLTHINLTKKTALGFTEGLEPATSDHIILDRLQAFLNSESLNIGPELIRSIREEYKKLGGS